MREVRAQIGVRLNTDTQIAITDLVEKIGRSRGAASANPLAV